MKTIQQTAEIKTTSFKSDCGKYRFMLSRVWNKDLQIGAFLCANPSKADELRYDMTVFKCGNLAVNWGWGGLFILNLYPNYSTNPSGVIRNAKADELNEKHVRKILGEVPLIVIACGNGHTEQLAKIIRDVPKEKLYCLRRNKGGGFLHPSRIEPDDFLEPVQVLSPKT
jgi:hypothetical protein